MTQLIDRTAQDGTAPQPRARARRTLVSGWRDIGSAVAGVGIMGAAFATPFLRDRRTRWGVGADAAREHPGDDLVPRPRWAWTHGIEIDAPAHEVWPWVVQIGAERGGFYSYQGLENLVGCRLRNADEVHPEWALAEGDDLIVHPEMPPLRVVDLAPGRWFVAYGEPSLDAIAQGEPWVAASWLFMVEPLGEGRCRVVSRYRCATSGDRKTQIQFGPALVEPIGFAMDRRMLLGIKERAEQAVPPFLPEPVRRDWRELARSTDDDRRFDPATLDDLPAPVARWLRHAIAPGTPLRRAARLRMHGEIRLGRWQPFSAEQVLAPGRGYVWAAEAGRRPLRVTGYDRYAGGVGEMRWRLLGAVPVMSAADDDISRSAAGRLAAESVLVPAAVLDPAVVWRPVDDHHATAAIPVGGDEHEVTVEVDDQGALRSVRVPRWGNPEGGSCAVHPFGVEFDGEVTVDGVTVPAHMRAGWAFGTDRWDDSVFFRATVDAVRHV
ncbi:MAG: hypothetical protein JXA83_08550 [Acidimicrobiales bacterium]|nr:hypothetical protein [Acidimicrobiales bacterium]